jgi:hypothetical protein
MVLLVLLAHIHVKFIILVLINLIENAEIVVSVVERMGPLPFPVEVHEHFGNGQHLAWRDLMVVTEFVGVLLDVFHDQRRMVVQRKNRPRSIHGPDQPVHPLEDSAEHFLFWGHTSLLG